MKFTTYFESLAGVSIYPIISLIIFILFFIGVTIFAMGKSSEEIEELENIPFDNDKNQNQ